MQIASPSKSPTLMRLQPAWLFLFVLLATMWAAYWLRSEWSVLEDDAFIHLNYARSVFEGDGFAFQGIPSNGDTAPAWVLALVGAYAITKSWIASAKLLSGIAFLFSASCIYAFAQKLQKLLRSDHSTLPLMATSLFLVNPFVCCWAFTGMEAVFAAGLLTLILLVSSAPRHTPLTFLTLCLALGIAPLIRPEFALLAVVEIPVLIYIFYVMYSEGNRRHQCLLALAGVGFLVTPVLLWAIYSVHAFGYILPNTNAAKRASPSTSIAFQLIKLYALGFLGVYLFTLAIAYRCLSRNTKIIFAYLRDLQGRGTLLRLVFSVVPLLICFVVINFYYIVNHTYVQTRYVLELGPALLVLVFTFASVFLSWPAVRCLYFVALICELIVSMLFVHPMVKNKSRHVSDIRALCSYIKSQTPASKKIAVYSIGEIAFLIPNELVDTGGITRPEATKFLWDSSPHRMVAWAKSEGASYYISGSRPDKDAVLAYERETVPVGWPTSLNYRHQIDYIRLWELR